MKASTVRGTPYRSATVSDDKAPKSTSGTFGEVIDTQTGVNFNRPESNGNGVILDGITRPSDYSPQSAAAMDSPVPQGAPSFPAGAMHAENLAHLGKGIGVNASQAGDVLDAIGGVMSRGMLGTSTPSGAENELTTDD